jgi:hypothetical protein
MSAPATAAKDALPDPEGMAAHIKRLVDAAPQCSAEQRDRLAAILCTPAAVRRRAA